MNNKITVGNLRKMVMESQDQFKPKVGDGVESENKKNNNKSYKDAETRSGAKEVKTKHNLDKKEDGNKTTLDYTFDVEPSKEYKARVHAQTKGYVSTQEEENKIEKNAEFDDAFYKQAKDAGKVLNQKEEDFKKTGLQASKQPKDAFKKKDMYENKMQTVRFKRTSFLTEEHMMSKIPDEMKVEGKRFKMVDMNENTYLCEWVKNKYNGKESATILENRNPKKVDESIEKMKRLYNFNVGEKTTTTTTQNRLYENNEGFTSTLNNIRKLIK